MSVVDVALRDTVVFRPDAEEWVVEDVYDHGPLRQRQATIVSASRARRTSIPLHDLLVVKKAA